MTLTFPLVDNQTYTFGGIVYRYSLATNLLAREGITATNAPGSVDRLALANGAVTPEKVNLAATLLSTPPVAPTYGPVYLVTAPATGAWAGKENQLATWDGAAWDFTIPYDGLVIWDAVADKLKAWDGTAWIIVNEYVAPTIPDVPANRIRGNLTAVAAPEDNFTAQQLVDWLQADAAAHEDLKNGIVGSGGKVGAEGINISVIDRDLSAPPVSPSLGDAYIVKATASGLWASKDGQLARWNGTAWVFTPITEGMLIWVSDENVLLGHDGAAIVQIYPATAAATTGIASFATGTLIATMVVAGAGNTITINSQSATGGAFSVINNNTTNAKVRFTFSAQRGVHYDYYVLKGGSCTIDAQTATHMDIDVVVNAADVINPTSGTLRFSAVGIGA